MITCSNILEKIRGFVEQDVLSVAKRRKTRSRLRLANIVSTVGSTTLSVSGIGVSGTGLGVIVRGPMIGVGALLGVVSLVVIRLDKNVVKRLTECEKLVILGNAKMSSIQGLVSKALSDGKISEVEFARVYEEGASYDTERNKILAAPKPLGADPKVSASTREITNELEGILSRIKKKGA